MIKGTILYCACLAALFLCSSPAARGGAILSEEVSIEEKDPRTFHRQHEFLVESMDVSRLSASARFLALPRPMITPELAWAMRSGRIQPPTGEWQRIIRKAAQTYHLPETLIAAVIHTESAFQADAVSPKGAQGAMQIMPETQQELGLEDPCDAEANVLAGSAYLRRQLDRFGSLELALAAYNAGPANVLKYGGIPPFPETQAYVRRVSGLHAAASGTAQPPAHTTLKTPAGKP